MLVILLVIHLLIAIALIGVVLLQRSEGGGLGVGSGGGGLGGFMTARGTANLLTRTTAGLAAAFMAMSLLLSILATPSRERAPLVDTPPALPSLPGPAPAGNTEAPATPQVPLAR